MKKNLIIITFFATICIASAQTQNTWTKKADFGGGERTEAVSFSIGTKGYVGTGFRLSIVFPLGYRKDFWEYDPSNGPLGTWTQKADFGGIARDQAVGFSIGSKGYIGTGLAGTALQQDFWEYDPGFNTWTLKTSFPGTARRGAVGFSIGTKGYIGTGYDGTFKSDFWEYDPSNGTNGTWTQKANFGGSARFVAVGFSIGAKGYIGTGTNGLNGTGTFMKDFWEYDQANNVWNPKLNFGGTGRFLAVGFSIGSKGYIGTGYDLTYKKDFWEYDPGSNVWKVKAPYGGAGVAGPIGFSIGTKGYIGTGDIGNGTQLKDFWEYFPETSIKLNILLQGYYLGGGLMSNCLYIVDAPLHLINAIDDADFVTISAMNAAPPHTLVDAPMGTLKTNGDVIVTFGHAVIPNTSYYLKVNHRNSIETWSAAPVLLNAITTYSFSSAVTQAFASNEAVTSDALYAAMYTGDINQDGAVDASDFLELDPSIQNGDGGYFVGDLNGDGAVDGSDFLVLAPTIEGGIGAITPP